MSRPASSSIQLLQYQSVYTRWCESGTQSLGLIGLGASSLQFFTHLHHLHLRGDALKTPKTTFLPRIWLTLDAAALRLTAAGLSVEPDDVLHMAALGKVRAYVRLREPIAVESVIYKLDVTGMPDRVVNGGGSIENFVLLCRPDAWRLEVHGEVTIRTIRQTEDDPLEPFEPADPEMKWRPEAPFVARKSEVVVLAGDVEALVRPEEVGEIEVQAGARGLAPSAWPWGSHETKLLVILRDAAVRHWSLYDPSDATTAPTNTTVVAWLNRKGVSAKIATSIATILRADGLPSGPRT